MPYYCNCTRAWEAKGVELPKKGSMVALGIHQYQEVQTNKQDQCVHCHHAAFFSRVHPDTPQERTTVKKSYLDAWDGV